MESGSRVGSVGASSLGGGSGSGREKSLFNSDPTKTLSAIQYDLEGKQHDGLKNWSIEYHRALIG